MIESKLLAKRTALAMMISSVLALTPTYASTPDAPSLCDIGTSCSGVDEPGEVSSAIKWNPGHYVISDNGAGLLKRLAYLDEIAEEPSIRGLQVRYYWNELEPRKGEYDFLALDALLDRAESVNKQIILEVWTRSFGGRLKPSPAYIQTEEYGGGDYSVYNDGTRFATRVWNPAVMDRLIALYQALGERYDSHPNFEAIATAETALGGTVTNLPGFSSTAATDQYLRLMQASRAAWPRTIVRLSTNYWPSQSLFVRLHNESLRYQYALGGPDIILATPAASTNASQALIVGATGEVDFRGKVPIMFNVESDLKKYEPTGIYDKAAYDLKATHISWQRNTWNGGPTQQWQTGVLPFIRSVGGSFPNVNCPESFVKGCTPSESETQE
jgi:hypothetical protein